MKKYLFITILALSMCLYFLPALSQAQEATGTTTTETQTAAQPAQEAEETEFSYGTVKSVTGNQLVVSEYDYDADKDIDVTYTVPPEAKLENVASVQEIAAGDIVDIDFVAKDGQKVVSLITVEKPTGQDEDLLLDEAAPDAGATS